MSKEINKYIEIFKTNMFLDAAKYVGEENIGNVSPVIALGVMGEVPYAEGQLIFGKYRLILEWNWKSPIKLKGKTCKDMEEYIKTHTEELYTKYVCKHSDYVYTLNVAMDNFPDVKFEYSFNTFKALAIKNFMPIIQLFIAKALTDTIEENLIFV